MRTSTIFALAAFLLTGLAIFAEADEMKARFAKRLPAINKLKAAQLVGESNKGYLEARGELSPADKKLVDDENADRKKIYAMLARKLNQNIEVVEKHRAAQIAERSKAGIWLQKPNGIWYRK